MKTVLKLVLIILMAGLVVTGCKKEEPATQPEPQQQETTPIVPAIPTAPGMPAGVVDQVPDVKDAVDAIETAMAFTLKDHTGKEHSLSDYLGKIVVLEWINPECPFVKRHFEKNTMIDLAKEYSDKGVVWLAINSSHHFNSEMNAEMVEQQNLPYPVLDDKNGTVGRLFDAKTTPHMFIIDKKGKIAYEGAIDDDPKGDKESVVNYVKKALDELIAGKSVSISETKPYGCTVKYKN